MEAPGHNPCPLTTALTSALSEALQHGAMTEPLQVEELAVYFGLERHAMARKLKTIPGVQRNGRRGLVRVPVCEMPPGYLADVALKAICSLEQFGMLHRNSRDAARHRTYNSPP